jgi:hypothetical protein
MKYIDYINYLKSNNINLFDYEYRVSYNNILYYNMKQTGGGDMIIKKYDIDELKDIINISLSEYPHYLLKYLSF